MLIYGIYINEIVLDIFLITLKSRKFILQHNHEHKSHYY